MDSLFTIDALNNLDCNQLNNCSEVISSNWHQPFQFPIVQTLGEISPQLKLSSKAALFTLQLQSLSKINSCALGHNQLIEFSDEAREELFSHKSLNIDIVSK